MSVFLVQVEGGENEGECEGEAECEYDCRCGLRYRGVWLVKVVMPPRGLENSDKKKREGSDGGGGVMPPPITTPQRLTLQTHIEDTVIFGLELKLGLVFSFFLFTAFKQFGILLLLSCVSYPLHILNLRMYSVYNLID